MPNKYKAKVEFVWFLDNIEAFSEDKAFEQLREHFLKNNGIRLNRGEVTFEPIPAPEEVKTKEEVKNGTEEVIN